MEQYRGCKYRREKKKLFKVTDIRIDQTKKSCIK